MSALTHALWRRWRQIGLGLAIGFFALWLALRGVPLTEVGAALAEVRPVGLLAVATLFLLQQGLRAWRQLLLVQAVVPGHRYRTSLSVLCISFFFINTLPARLGEAVRPLLLWERDRLPLGSGVAMVVVERALDLASMFAMLALVVWFTELPDPVVTVAGLQFDWVAMARRLAAVGLPLMGLGGIGLLWRGRRVLAWLGRLPAGTSLLARGISLVLRFGGGFMDGIDALRSPRRLAGVLALTASTWALTGLMYPALAHALHVGELIGWFEGIGVLGITMLGMTIPSAPGFAGTYEAFVRAALALFGMRGPGLVADTGVSLDATAVAFALTIHWLLYLVQSATAVAFLAVDRIDPRRLLSPS